MQKKIWFFSLYNQVVMGQKSMCLDVNSAKKDDSYRSIIVEGFY